jgi:4-aminobutyrate aminotransferase / (S)-3-amino-2-methylpropionate transaminase / 5-aminovalerate transaminase
MTGQFGSLEGFGAPDAAETRSTVAGCIMPLHDVRILRGVSSTVETADGRQLVDLTGGLGALILGYTHPRVTAAIREQAGNLVHASYPTMPFAGYERIAAWLGGHFVGPSGPYVSALFNSGAEAVENAMKVAGWVTGRPTFAALRAGFHGRTIGAASLTHRAVPYRAGLTFGMPWVVHLDDPAFEEGTPRSANLGPEEADADHWASRLEVEIEAHGVSPQSLAAVIYEPIQGEGGIRRLTKAYLLALRRLADRTGALLIADEIQSGCGRTGVWFPSWQEETRPDIVVTGKAMGGGLPLSALSAPAELLGRLPRGALGGTMGGNPLACAAGLATVEELEEGGWLSAAGRIEAAFRAVFADLPGRSLAGCEARLHAFGAMLAIELIEPEGAEPGLAAETVQRVLRGALEYGALCLRGGERGATLRLLPPLTITEDELKRGLSALRGALLELPS